MIVSDKTLQHAVSGCVRAVHNDWSVASIDDFGTRVAQLNADAFAARYPKEERYQPRPFRWRMRLHSMLNGPKQHLQSLCTALKALDCLVYNCAEGHIPETALFKELEEYQDRLRREIVRALPEYESAPWCEED